MRIESQILVGFIIIACFIGCVQAVNTPPVADANGPYVLSPQVQPWSLDGTGSYDPDGDPLTYAWDLDGDDGFTDASGPTPDVTTFFTTLGVGTYSVRLEVTDTSDESAVDPTTVTVLCPHGTLTGRITDAITGLPIEGAEIQEINYGGFGTSDVNGYYEFCFVPAGVIIAVKKEGYETVIDGFELTSEDRDVVRNYALMPPTVIISTETSGEPTCDSICGSGECYSLCKVGSDYTQVSGDCSGITFSNNDTHGFDWMSTTPVVKIIVNSLVTNPPNWQHPNTAYLYEYDPTRYGDGGMVTYDCLFIDSDVYPTARECYDINHIEFCASPSVSVPEFPTPVLLMISIIGLLLTVMAVRRMR